MKIAFVVHDYNRHSGHSRYVAELASRFKIEHEVHIFANTWEEPNPEGLQFHKIPVWNIKELFKVLTFIIPATIKIPKGFDIVHAQGLCGLRHDLVTVHIIQKTWLRELLARTKFHKSLGSKIWQLLVTPLESLALGPRCSKAVIAISEKVKKDLIRDYRIKNNVFLVYHGVDTENFHPNNKELFRQKQRAILNLSDDDLVGIYVGNLKKGASVAIKAVAKTTNWKLIVVTGSENSAELSLAKEMGVDGRIYWVNLSKEIHRWYSAADCLVFPTFFDTFGMVIAEAMATGLPVITNRNAGASELIVDGVSGLLTKEAWDVEEIKNRLTLLENNKEQARQIGINARKAIEPFTWDKCAIHTMNVYETILAERAKKNLSGLKS